MVIILTGLTSAAGFSVASHDEKSGNAEIGGAVTFRFTPLSTIQDSFGNAPTTSPPPSKTLLLVGRSGLSPDPTCRLRHVGCGGNATRRPRGSRTR